jgi:hypothetical protein
MRLGREAVEGSGDEPCDRSPSLRVVEDSCGGTGGHRDLVEANQRGHRLRQG